MIDITVRAELDGNKLIIPVKEYAEFIKPMLEKRDGVLSIRLEVPTKKKTSPENRLFHKLVSSLAMWMNTDLETMKMFVKRYASAAHGYDQVTFTASGHTIITPKSLTDATNDDMINKLIPTCYELGLDWGCPLEQPEDYNGKLN